MLKNIFSLTAIALLVTACSHSTLNNEAAVQASTSASKHAMAVQDEKISDASAQANKTFDEIFDAGIMRYPQWQTYLGIKKDYDKWNDLSAEFAEKELALNKADLAKLQAMDTRLFDAQTKLSHRLFVQDLSETIDDYQWRYHNYPINQMFGTHSDIPAFLINQHSIANKKEALDYIARVTGTQVLLAQVIAGLKTREHLGIIAPKFVFAHALRDANNIISGAPFDSGEASTLLTDFSTKVNKLELSDEEKSALIAQLNSALTTYLKPGYQQLISYLTHLETQADDRAGAWKLPEGNAYFNNALKRTTTTHLTAEEIHQIGLAEVARIHDEMQLIKDKVGFDGSLQDFMVFMRTDAQFYYPNTEEGRVGYLNEAVAIIDDMQERLDELFIVKPNAELKVKRVEAFREQSAGKAFYQQPAPDGSRPGIYYANLYEMAAMPSYQLAALAYHEGIPGHHMQISIKQELTGIPKFRKFGHYTAYTEGWGLYAEYIPKEMGLYQDPYADFGRLSMELWRACRLVVDTGIHHQKWTREQGINYYIENTPNAESDAIKMVERHIVMPSQATAYKVGMLKILALRDKAQQALGQRYDIREYHDVVLKNGAVPLNVLEELVDIYIDEKSTLSEN